MPALTYTVGPFLPFTKIVSADMNSKLGNIQTLLNTTKLDSFNVQLNGLTRDRLALGTPNYVAINGNTGLLSEEAQLAITRGGLGQDFTPSFSTNMGNAVIVNNAGNSFTLGSPLTSQITETPASVANNITAGEALAANDAVCLDLALNGSSALEYRVFKTNLSKGTRTSSFLGFAVSAVSVTPQIQTFVFSANLVSSNVITYSINGVTYSTTFSSSNTATLAALATQIATDPNVASAVSDTVHTITVTTIGAVYANFSGAVVTSGASQPTITVTQTQAPVGGPVQIRTFGPLTGLTSLTTGNQYYLDPNTAGGITTAAGNSAPITVAQALSSTVLFVTPNSFYYQFTVPNIFIKSQGWSSSSGTPVKADTEHFNFSTWAAGTTSGLAGRADMGAGEYTYVSNLMQIDGSDAGGSSSPTGQFQQYNKTTWSTLTNKANNRYEMTNYQFNGFFFVVGGVRAGVDSQAVDKWNGAVWGVGTNITSTIRSSCSFTQGGFFHSAIGYSGGATNVHYTYSASDVVATSTVAPYSKTAAASSNCGSGGANNGMIIGDTTTSGYFWNGSAWSSATTLPYTIQGDGGLQIDGCAGFRASVGTTYVNGGADGSSNPLTTSASFTGNTWSTATASTNARRGHIGGVV